MNGQTPQATTLIIMRKGTEENENHHMATVSPFTHSADTVV